MNRLEEGTLTPSIEMCVDAKAVFDAIDVADVTTPQEASLKLHLIALRDRLQRGVIRALYWTDTRDMVSDCLTKGGVDRSLIHNIMSGRVQLQYDYRRCPRAKRKFDPTEADRNNPYAHPAKCENWVDEVKIEIRQLYSKYEKLNCQEIEALVLKHKGREEMILRALRRKYQPGHFDIGGFLCDEAEMTLRMRRGGEKFLNKKSAEAHMYQELWAELAPIELIDQKAESLPPSMWIRVQKERLEKKKKKIKEAAAAKEAEEVKKKTEAAAKRAAATEKAKELKAKLQEKVRALKVEEETKPAVKETQLIKEEEKEPLPPWLRKKTTETEAPAVKTVTAKTATENANWFSWSDRGERRTQRASNWSRGQQQQAAADLEPPWKRARNI